MIDRYLTFYNRDLTNQIINRDLAPGFNLFLIKPGFMAGI